MAAAAAAEFEKLRRRKWRVGHGANTLSLTVASAAVHSPNSSAIVDTFIIFSRAFL